MRTARRRAAHRAALAAAVPSELSLRLEGAARNARTALGARARGCARCHRLACAVRRRVGGRICGRARLPSSVGNRPRRARRSLGWQSTLDELARLTPIVGEISLDGALSRARSFARAHDACGAAAVRRARACGASKTSAPATTPSGSRDSRIQHGPSRRTAIRCCRSRCSASTACRTRRLATPRSDRSASLERLVRRSRELVVSWPARVYDYETEPSPAIRLVADASRRRARRAAVERAAAHAPRAKRSSTPLHRSAAAACRAGRERSAGRPAAPCGRSVRTDSARGSSSRSHSACRHGLRGIATHRAAERLLGESDCARVARGQGEQRGIERRSARSRACSGARAVISRHCTSSKPTSCNVCCAALLRAEARRAPFRVRAVEQESVVTLGPLTFNVRIDRIDELADGTIAIIDYKTGERATSADWFGERLRDAQVPLYADAGERARERRRRHAAVVA